MKIELLSLWKLEAEFRNGLDLFLSPHHSDQMCERSKVNKIGFYLTLIVLVPWHPSGRDDYEDDDELMMMIMEMMMMTQIMIFRTKIVF